MNGPYAVSLWTNGSRAEPSTRVVRLGIQDDRAHCQKLMRGSVVAGNPKCSHVGSPRVLASSGMAAEFQEGLLQGQVFQGTQG